MPRSQTTAEGRLKAGSRAGGWDSGYAMWAPHLPKRQGGASAAASLARKRERAFAPSLRRLCHRAAMPRGVSRPPPPRLANNGSHSRIRWHLICILAVIHKGNTWLTLMARVTSPRRTGSGKTAWRMRFGNSEEQFVPFLNGYASSLDARTFQREAAGYKGTG